MGNDTAALHAGGHHRSDQVGQPAAARGREDGGEQPDELVQGGLRRARSTRVSGGERWSGSGVLARRAEERLGAAHVGARGDAVAQRAGRPGPVAADPDRLAVDPGGHHGRLAAARADLGMTPAIAGDAHPLSRRDPEAPVGPPAVETAHPDHAGHLGVGEAMGQADEHRRRAGVPRAQRVGDGEQVLEHATPVHPAPRGSRRHL